MADDMGNIEFARENEVFASNLDLENQPARNWAVIVRFYSYLHFVEERLQAHGYDSRSHKDRTKNIRNCRHIDNKARKIYRLLEDVSRDARYECIRMSDEDIQMSEKKLEEGKRVLGFTGNGSSHKYST